MSIEQPASEAEIRAILEQVDAIITGSHLVYTSGRHGSSYVNKDALYPHTAATRQVCAAIAVHFRDADVEVVAGPTVGGVIMAQWVAHHLSELTCRSVLAVYAEESGAQEKRRIFRRGYDELIAGKRVLVVEDVLTTGGSARQVVDAVRDAGGQVVGLGALCNRGGLTAAALDVPAFVALVTVPLESWDAAECPLCRAGVPINTRVGKGAAFLARQSTAS
ncbi:MAG: phosphoribosyltransferase family protein [Chloroflexaceae bacterium]